MSAGSNSRCFAGLAVLLLLVSVAFAILFAIYFTKYNDKKDDYDELYKQSLRDSTTTTATTTLTPTVTITTSEPVEPTEEKYYGDFRYAAVVSGAKPCSTIGLDIMAKMGGTAVDAAIASSVCVSAFLSADTGIGGGGFMTIYQQPKNGVEKEMKSLIAREVAPLAATQDMFVNNSDSSRYGGLAIGVPGEIKGYYAAWETYGRVPWEQLFEPTIKLCEEGITVFTSQAEALRFPFVKDNLIKYNMSEIMNTFYPDGEPLQEGAIYTRPKFAETLRAIAEDPNSFYTGQLAQDIVDDIQECGGIVTTDDLSQYEVAWKDPVKVHLDNGDYDVYGPPPPSSGVIVQFILNILDGYGMSREDLNDTDSTALLYHRMVEAFKFGYGKRSSLGDEDFVDISQIKADLMSDAFATAFRQKIDDNKTYNLSHYEPDFENNQDGGTNGLLVLAPDGSAVSVTSTVNLFYGSLCKGSRTGIIFNNEMDDFSTPGLVNTFGFSPSPSNYIEPGKRPMSSMSPTIVLDSNKDVVMMSSASGGSWIITQIVKNLVDLLWLDKEAGESVKEPRLHHQLLPDYLYHFREFPEDILNKLQARGHILEPAPPAFYASKLVSILKRCVQDCQDCREPCIQASCEYRRRKHCEPDGL